MLKSSAFVLVFSMSLPLAAHAQDSAVIETGDRPAGQLDATAFCPVRMLRVGPVCVDQYEATVWSKPPGTDGSPRGRQFGLDSDDYDCLGNGDDCVGRIFAVPLRGRFPSAYITWFQAQHACFNVGKRLPTNAEWQVAASGTPTAFEPGADDGVDDCNTTTATVASRTGARRHCVSSYGAYDMVGNLLEWVADWMQGPTVPFAPSLGTAGPDFGNDFMRGTNPAIAQNNGQNFPAALVRGGGFVGGTGAGVFALNARFSPADGGPDGGFRCVK
jgi:formylglycine-generating enzyme required for sulfatase activity